MYFLSPDTHFSYDLRFKMTRFFCLLTIVLVLAGCKTLTSESQDQGNTATLKAVSDSQYFLRLAPYKGSDSSQLVFEVCQISSPNDGCAIAFLSSIRQPVLFTAREIDQHSESSAKAMAKFVSNNSEFNDEVLAASGGFVTFQVGARLKGPDFMDIKHLIDDRRFNEAQEALAERKGLLSEKLGLEIDKSHYNALKRGDLHLKVPKPAKLEAHLKAHGSVYKKDFIDFLKAEYSKELIANSKTAEEVLEWASLHSIHSDWDHRPRIDFGMLVREYRKHLHGGIISDIGSNSDYEKAIDDIMHPAMAKEFEKYNKLREVADDVVADSIVIGRDSLQEVLASPFPLKPSEFLEKGLSYYGTGTKSIGTSAVSHLMDFTQHKFPDEILRHKYLRDTAELDLLLYRHLPNTAATKSVTQSTTKPTTEPTKSVIEPFTFKEPDLPKTASTTPVTKPAKSVIEPFTFKDPKMNMGKASDPVVEKVIKGGSGKHLAKRVKRVPAVFMVIAAVLGGAAGAKKILGVGSSADNNEEGIARTHPSLFKASASTSPVESVQGIVVQLGEYLNKSGVDIDYFCMPSGCHLLH